MLAGYKDLGLLFGSKRDKAPKAADPREPTFFDELFDKALEAVSYTHLTLPTTAGG